MKNCIVVAMILSFMMTAWPPACGAAGDAERHEVLIAQGIRKINEGKPSEALVLLTEAMKLAPDNAEASYYAGIAASKLGNFQEAETLLLKTLNLKKDAVPSYLELGRLYYLTARCDRAEELFTKFLDHSDNPALKKEARSLIQSCGKSAEEEGEKPYRIQLTLGGQDDSNVLLEPSNPPSAISRESDNKAIAKLFAETTLLKKDRFTLKGDYTLYQSLHRHLTDFNINYQKIKPELDFAFTDRLKFTAGYAFEYIYFGGETYGRTHTYFGKAEFQEVDPYSTELHYEYRDHKYWDTDLFLLNSVRSGHLKTVGIKQNLGYGKTRGSLYYDYDQDKTEVDYWDYNGYRTGADAITGLTSSFFLTLAGEFNQRRYRAIFPTFDDNRLDRTRQGSIGLHYLLNKKMRISFTDTYAVNHSNLDSFEYKRNVAGIYFTVGVL